MNGDLNNSVGFYLESSHQAQVKREFFVCFYHSIPEELW